MLSLGLITYNAHCLSGPAGVLSQRLFMETLSRLFERPKLSDSDTKNQLLLNVFGAKPENNVSGNNVSGNGKDTLIIPVEKLPLALKIKLLEIAEAEQREKEAARR